jgi:membrane-bound lytic murein transglycosylase D
MAIEPDVPDTKRILVRVGKRDNLASIAHRYKVSVAQLKGWNGLHRDAVTRGQTLQVQVPYRLASHHGSRHATHLAAHGRHAHTKLALAPKKSGKVSRRHSGSLAVASR